MLVSDSGTGNGALTFVAGSTHGWDLDWKYDCSTTGQNGVFVVDVYGADNTPDFKHPGVNEQGDKDAGVYHVPENGRFHLEITTTCKWTLKVVDAA
ncbi:MAG TPA: hypothetical protein VFR33_11440 [Candidatus Dormibacteraeota bacterium]|nr:hypothetical protein [Candidatus Dormibacteraeota bacterium]